ncbi:MAG: hypothetical protein JWR77_1140 [Rhizorhabdus sp.]|nr:hypothetical protein [Rhizorhabdus sp.]
MRLLILGSLFDTMANMVGEHVRQRHGPTAVVHRTLEDLAAAQWCHRLGWAGVKTDLTFADGTSFAGFAPTMILNRLDYDPALLFTRMKVVDRDYARTEFFALLLSWLSGLGRIVVNQVAPSGLSGPMLRPWQWIMMARDAGLPAYPSMAGTSARRSPAPPDGIPRPELMPATHAPALALLGYDRPLTHGPRPAECRDLLVLEGRVIDRAGQPVDPALAAASIRLARAVHAEILTIELARLDGDPTWRFVGADPRPRLLDGAWHEALIAWMEERA